mgnify:CR=1 FL=1
MKNLDWSQLSFGYTKTDYNVRCYYRDGKWIFGIFDAKAEQGDAAADEDSGSFYRKISKIISQISGI